MYKEHRVASVVLNYNSVEDVEAILPQLLAQQGVRHTVILVDNASEPEQVAKLEQLFSQQCPQGVVTTRQAILADCRKPSEDTCYLVLSDENRGYSAGNNIGARLAVKLKCDAVLVANPDIRIEDNFYIKKLTERLFSKESVAMAGSSIFNLSGKNENPMHEPKFTEELLWPVSMILKSIRGRGIEWTGAKERSTEVIEAEKLSGCCFVIKSDFIREIGFFDENVFLYCEESILAAQLKSRGLSIAYCGELEVLHAHDSTKKGASEKRYAAWSRSRAYFLRTYTGYGLIARALLAGSRAMMLALVRGRGILNTMRNGMSARNPK